MGNFIDTITEKTNLFKETIYEYRDKGSDIWLYGCGGGADAVEKRFPDFPFKGKMVDKAYFKNQENTVCLEDFLSSINEKIVVVVTFRNYSPEVFTPYKDKLQDVLFFDCFVGNVQADASLMTYDYIVEHSSDLQRVADKVSDELSVKALSAYINQKISMKYGFLEKVKTKPQYFEEDIVPLSDNETFVDCGAYIGDSALSFIDALHKRGINSYNKIISFEPVPSNYEKMVKQNLSNHVCLNMGVSDSQGTIGFSDEGASSAMSDSGETIVKVDSLDKLIDEKVTFIKMDIEGIELAALRGATNLIKSSRPKLAICIYHKKEDLWEILDFVESLDLNYDYYIRAYESDTIELVFYAIPR